MIRILATEQGIIMVRKLDFSQEKMWERNNIFCALYSLPNRQCLPFCNSVL